MIERLLLFGTSGDLVGRHWLASKGYLATSAPHPLIRVSPANTKKNREMTSGLEPLTCSSYESA
jgi:hypothetical protein